MKPLYDIMKGIRIEAESYQYVDVNAFQLFLQLYISFVLKLDISMTAMVHILDGSSRTSIKEIGSVPKKK